MRNFFVRYSPFIFMCALVLFGVLIGGFVRRGVSYDNPYQGGNQAEYYSLEVGKLVAVPEGEMPQVAVVRNTEVLKNQAFFAEAKEGDIVLIYSRKAVLYDPVAKKVIIVAPVNMGIAQEPTELLPKFQGEQIDVDDPGATNEF